MFESTFLTTGSDIIAGLRKEFRRDRIGTIDAPQSIPSGGTCCPLSGQMLLRGCPTPEEAVAQLDEDLSRWLYA